MPAIEHPLLAQADEFIAALLAFEAAIPEPSPKAGALDDSPAPKIKRRLFKSLGTVIVPGGGQAVYPNVTTITDHTPQSPDANRLPTGGNSGPNTNSFEGLPGGGGGGW